MIENRINITSISLTFDQDRNIPMLKVSYITEVFFDEKKIGVSPEG